MSAAGFLPMGLFLTCPGNHGSCRAHDPNEERTCIRASEPRTICARSALVYIRLAGEDIPVCGRIVALADVYDALTSKRVYKEAFAHTVARNIIVEEAGSHFDPRVVNAFTGSEDEFKAIRADYAKEVLVTA